MWCRLATSIHIGAGEPVDVYDAGSVGVPDCCRKSTRVCFLVRGSSKRRPRLLARIPGHGSFAVTRNAAAMIGVFGGLLHCYQGNGGCRKQGLFFSRTEPKKALRCLLGAPARTIPTREGNTAAKTILQAMIGSSSASAMNWLRNLAVPSWTSAAITRWSALSG